VLEHVDLTAGQSVLVNGTGGAVGGYAVQLAKSVSTWRARPGWHTT
jgi:NADPH:quinone reductase-like Zn-dependent oxidoreductase